MNSKQPDGLIGGIGLTEVTVYAQRYAPDGTYSGCPHVHAVTDEGYFVLQGTGTVEFHDMEHGYRSLPLKPGHYVHFPALMMHRLISDGDLVILGIMGNAGLAERGEARIYFGSEADQDEARYRELMSLPSRLGIEGALQRRDAAVTGYQSLMALWHNDKTEYFKELQRFLRKHAAAMASLADSLTSQVESGPTSWANSTLSRIKCLPGLSPASPEVSINIRGSESALGMCGMLRPISQLEKMS